MRSASGRELGGHAGAAAGSGGATGAGGSTLPKCTGQLYDACTTTSTGNNSSSNCASAMCRPLMGATAVCTQSCAGPSDCPAQNGQTVTCAGQGYCKPTSANPTCVAP